MSVGCVGSGSSAIAWIEKGDFIQALVNMSFCIFLAVAVVLDVWLPDVDIFRLRCEAGTDDRSANRYRRALEASFWRRSRT